MSIDLKNIDFKNLDFNGMKEKITKWLIAAFELYKENFVLVFLISAIPLAISALSMLAFPSILGVIFSSLFSGPLIAGIFLILFRLLDKSQPKPEIQDLAKGIDYMQPALLFIFAWAIVNFIGTSITSAIPGIGWILSFLFSSALTAVAMFGMPLIVDKKLDFITAAKTSLETIQPDIVLFIIFSLVISFITMSGVFLLVVGIFFTIPFNACAVAVAYKDVFANVEIRPKEAKKEESKPEKSKEETNKD